MKTNILYCFIYHLQNNNRKKFKSEKEQKNSEVITKQPKDSMYIENNQNVFWEVNLETKDYSHSELLLLFG